MSEARMEVGWKWRWRWDGSGDGGGMEVGMEEMDGANWVGREMHSNAPRR